MNGESLDGEDLSDPSPHPETEEGLEHQNLGPRDFLAAQEDGSADHFYRIGRFALPESGVLTAVIAVAEIEGRLLVALPEAVWHRTIARRLLPQRALTKGLLCSVAACGSDSRDLAGFDSIDIKVWFGYLHPAHEEEIDYVSQEEIGFHFTPEGEDLMLPYGPALLEVAQAHFAFTTADEGLPTGVPQTPSPAAGVTEERFQKLELALEGISRSLQQIVGAKTGASPKTLARPLPPPPVGRGPNMTTGTAAQPSSRVEVEGLAPEVVQSALAAGIPMEHLKEMGAVLRSKPKRLDEMPRHKPPAKVRRGPLSESEDAEEELEMEGGADGLDACGDPGAGGKAQSEMERAIVKLTSIASKLAGPQGKHKIDSLLDGGGGAVGSGESSTSTGSRKNAAAMRALQKVLVEDPKYLYRIMEANVQSDFLARPVQPGEPMTPGTTIRGWLSSRSRIQLYHNHVRWSWQVAGIWDCLIAGRHEEARARCGLLVAAADQASIDGGNWIVSNVALLESPPPYQNFSHHQAPSALELQHSVIYDPRWAETFLGHLKEVDSFVDAKRKLSSGKGASKESTEGGTLQPRAKPKAKAKEKGDKGKKWQDGPSQDSGGSTAA